MTPLGAKLEHYLGYIQNSSLFELIVRVISTSRFADDTVEEYNQKCIYKLPSLVSLFLKIFRDNSFLLFLLLSRLPIGCQHNYKTKVPVAAFY